MYQQKYDPKLKQQDMKFPTEISKSETNGNNKFKTSSFADPAKAIPNHLWPQFDKVYLVHEHILVIRQMQHRLHHEH